MRAKYSLDMHRTAIEQADLLEETYTTEPFRAKTGYNEYNFL